LDAGGVGRQRRHPGDGDGPKSSNSQNLLRRHGRRLALGGFGDVTTTVNNYTVGTLVVDLFDVNSKKLIWRGSSSETLSNKPDKNIKALDKDVQKMFDHFPPGGGK
jgi:hypothetical protein